MATLRSPTREGDRRHTFVPTRLPTACRFLDADFVRRETERKAEPGKALERDPDPLFTADLRLRLGKR
jgi:hypothetical protein